MEETGMVWRRRVLNSLFIIHNNNRSIHYANMHFTNISVCYFASVKLYSHGPERKMCTTCSNAFTNSSQNKDDGFFSDDLPADQEPSHCISLSLSRSIKHSFLIVNKVLHVEKRVHKTTTKVTYSVVLFPFLRARMFVCLFIHPYF